MIYVNDMIYVNNTSYVNNELWKNSDNILFAVIWHVLRRVETKEID